MMQSIQSRALEIFVTDGIRVRTASSRFGAPGQTLKAFA